jgi:Asp/Glu/hydantoin racemase
MAERILERIPERIPERILVINPNASLSCTEAIAAAIAPFAAPGLPRIEVKRLAEGPPAIVTWRDWYGVAEPLCRLVEAEPADAYVIACVSDPGLEAVRSVTAAPVFGVFRSAVAAALMRGERFGIIAFTEQSKPRQRRALQALGVESRLAGSIALNLDMELLTDPVAPRIRIAEAAEALVAMGAESIILGCAGMAGHRDFAEEHAGVPVIEPCQAAVVQAILAVVSARGGRMRSVAA